ncbi:hypothetical protein CR513_17101, partial [Mucuna pruriens]
MGIGHWMLMMPFLLDTPLAVTPLPCRPHTSDNFSLIFSDINLWERTFIFFKACSITMPATRIDVSCKKHHYQQQGLAP